MNYIYGKDRLFRTASAGVILTAVLLTGCGNRAEIFLRGRDIPIVTDDRLMEMCFGEYEGLENSFDIPDCPINVLFREPEKYKPASGAESIEELFARTGEFMKEKADPLLREGKDVLIVGHGAMNCSIICRVKNIPLRDFWSAGIENCKLMKLI